MCSPTNGKADKSPSSRPFKAKIRRIFSFSKSGSQPPYLYLADMSNDPSDSTRLNVKPYNLVEAFDKVIDSRNAVLRQNCSQDDLASPIEKTKFSKIDRPKGTSEIIFTKVEDAELVQAGRDFERRRENVVERERTIGFEFGCASKPLDGERDADKVIQNLKEHDLQVYQKADKLKGYAGQEHTRFAGDRFLLNATYIEETRLFRVMEAMPKGAHLHIHFNANLLPHVLLDIAKGQEHMYIMSDIPLTSKENFERCSLKFSILSVKTFGDNWKGKPDLFQPASKSCAPGDTSPKHVMKFGAFRDIFAKKYEAAYGGDDKSLLKDVSKQSLVDIYLTRKIVFQADEAYNPQQTAQRAWERFNVHTQMMKGLFNYVSAYREYTQACLEEFVKDRIQYAEIRPNFMETNQVWSDNGETKLDNYGIMNLIVDVYEKFQESHGHKIFKGLKIIYCTPRSFQPRQVEFGLNECLDMKLHPKYGKYIAGFDLVGEEGAGQPLKAFIKEFLEFKAKCTKAGVEIPFLFHCGETLDVGTDTDGNLVDALLLGSKRIGHGFALAWHPYVMQQMKKNNVCVEVCPISNEILGLTPRISGHTVYNLLANDVHCTVSTDNGTLFRSRLTHDLYQVVIGKADMTLYGLRQLLEWSIEHSCMDEKDKWETLTAFRGFWVTWCKWVVSKEAALKADPLTVTPLKL
ncbi:hypothetical protein B0T20DRAFT_389884 [Sordaria brevicollis]|uniref:Adenosine deaminase domain-containing protein n=1 Tax=Sordaria brevicollis TaxID=83679 RepID=A0AAE0UFY2_SORBR|nr:hypothetical protein B0T20DRAFT_389884 [Sordaria brevicollis]